MSADISQRADKWLWHARLVKTRTLAGELVARGRLRVNRRKVRKASTPVRPGDILTFFHGGRVRTIRVVGRSDRRGPAAEAQQLYVDLDDGSQDGCVLSTHGDQIGGA